MNRVSLVCVVLLAGSLCMAGCVQNQAGRGNVTGTPAEIMVVTASPAVPSPPVTVLTVQETSAKTCSMLGGDICSDDEDCPGSWLDAADSFSCCSKPCSKTGGVVLTIVPFEPLPPYEEQEPISL
jgi:hypothetical protein